MNRYGIAADEDGCHMNGNTVRHFMRCFVDQAFPHDGGSWSRTNCTGTKCMGDGKFVILDNSMTDLPSTN